MFHFVQCDALGRTEGLIASTSIDWNILGYWGKLSTAEIVEVTYQVSANDRDGEEIDDTTWDEDGWDSDGIRVGDDSGTDHDMGMAWTGVAVPKGAKILSATIEVFCKWESSVGINPQTLMYGFAVDDLAAFGASNRPSQIAQTTAFVDQKYDGEEDYRDEEFVPLYDAADLIQEIVDRDGWVSGNALGVVWKENGSPSSYRWQLQTYNRSTSQAAKITINYIVLGGIPHTIRNQYNFRQMPALLTR